MTEKDMEDLIATFPDDFFPRKCLVLVGRQQSFSGVGRFDLLFEDEFKSSILMELKARTLKYEDATQVARYRDELKRNGCRNIVMWLVSPHVPSSVREFLEDKGIEFTEIHIPEFRRVAERHSFVVKSESKPEQRIAVPAAEPLHRLQRVPESQDERRVGSFSISQRIKSNTTSTGNIGRRIIFDKPSITADKLGLEIKRHDPHYKSAGALLSDTCAVLRDLADWAGFDSFEMLLTALKQSRGLPLIASKSD
jgi:hypothetical protein